MIKNKTIALLGVICFLFPLIVGCSNNKLAEKETEVEGQGTTYTFQLPDSWRKQDDFQSIYGTQAVYGAEDTRSKSNLAVIIVPKDSIKEDGFGERTRKELAAQNGYKNEKDVYFAKEKMNGNEVFKYTFETTFKNKKTWAHFYSIFTEHAVIQFLYYSAQDSSYEDRVKIIDQSIATVKEVGYSAEKAAEEEKKNQKDTITFSTDAYDVSIVGLGVLEDEENNQLVALRYSFKNKSASAQKSDSWKKDITLTQAGETLTETTLPKESTNYDIVRLQEAAESTIEKDQTTEGVLLFKTNGTATMTLSLGEGVQSEEQQYSLQLPTNK